MFPFSHDAFLERLQQCAGSPWTIFEAQHHIDALVLQPDMSSMDVSHAEAPSYVDFLANIFHRRLLRCFIGGNVGRVWTLEDLLKQTRPPSPQALFDALGWCDLWQIVLSESAASTWRGHPRLSSLNNLGWTFEWLLQVLLEQNYGALVRRHVILGEIRALGEMDLLALLSDGRSLLVECKSSSKGLTDRQLDRFIAKACGFPADRALLLIDSDDSHQMQQRIGQVAQARHRVFGDTFIGEIQRYGGSSVICLRDHLYVADTGGGILTTLGAVFAEPLSLR